VTDPQEQIVSRISALLAEAAGLRVSRVSTGQRRPAADFLLRAGPYRFVVVYKPSGAAGPVSGGIEQLKKYAAGTQNLTLLVAVPYMGDVGKSLCEKAEMNWIDLSGNAHLSAHGLLIHVEGRPNLFKAAGRPPDVFAPKSSRITRALLANWYSAWTVEGLERRTGSVTSRRLWRWTRD